MSTEKIGLENIGNSVSQDYIYTFNREEVQARKPEGERQYSFEKLDIKSWKEVEITGEDLLMLQGFVETSGEVSTAYWFWKLSGKVRLGEIAEFLNNPENEIPEEAQYWTRENLSSEDKIARTDEYIKQGKILPPLLVFPVDKKGNRQLNKGLLNMGNILDGNHRLIEEVQKYLLLSDEEKKNYRLTVYVGELNPRQYAFFNFYYFVEPVINMARRMPRKVMDILKGKPVKDIDPHNIMNVPDRFRLRSQRLGKV